MGRPTSVQRLHSDFTHLHRKDTALDEASTQELLEAMAKCDRGEFVTAEEVFASLPPRH